jgi:hypothetical protein
MYQTKTPNQIVTDIDGYIRRYGRAYSEWYVGIASNPRDRLFVDHCVSETSDRWIFRDAGTDASARAIEQAFLNAGCKGGPCGGDYTTKFVYAYLITNSTCE